MKRKNTGYGIELYLRDDERNNKKDTNRSME
jgi:hypothetical protein